jgi:2-keto-4-pentenoate hydratase
LTPATENSLREGLHRGQEAFRDSLAQGAGRLGWKAGFGTTAATRTLGTSGPLAAPLTDATLAPSGSGFDISGWGKPVLEPEVAVLLVADLEAGQSGAEIEAAVGSVGAAIELVDLGEAGDDASAILAAGIFHRAVLVGEMTPLDPDTSLADLRVDVSAGGEDHALGADPAAVLGDLVEVLAGMAELLALGEERLRAGDLIITGAAIKPFELVGGETVEVRLGPSEVSAHVLPAGTPPVVATP